MTILDGQCDSAFNCVKDVFAAHLADGRQLGAAVSVFVDGRSVVDLWGGHQDSERKRPWQRDTIVCMMSTGKAMGALCVMMLADRGLLDLDDPVVKHWPEYGKAGKESTTVRQVLAHLAGVVYLDDTDTDSPFDYQALIRAVENKTPDFAPGKQLAYHTFTIGFLVRELVQRVAGQTVADFFRSEVADKLGAEFALSLDEAEQSRCARYYTAPDELFPLAIQDHGSPLSRAWRLIRDLPFEKTVNSVAWRTWGVPNIAHGNARGLARVYAALARGGELDDQRVLSESMVDEVIREHANQDDAVLGGPIRHALGFLLPSESYPFVSFPNCFFGIGAGGATAFGDRESGVAMAYCLNQASQYFGDMSPALCDLMAAVRAGL